MNKSPSQETNKVNLTIILILRLLALSSLFVLSACDCRPPGAYESRIVIEVHPPFSIVPPGPLTQAQILSGALVSRPRSSRDAAQEIISPENLDAASALCGIGPNILRNSLQVIPREESFYLAISAFHDDSKTSELIVTSIVDSFIASESAYWQNRADRAIEALDQELLSHGKIVNETKDSLTDFLQANPEIGKSNLSPSSETAQSYNSLKDGYEQSRDLLREMKIQQQEQRVLLKMPRNPITIHEALVTKNR